MVHKLANLILKLLISNLIGLPLGCPPHCHNLCSVCYLIMCLLTGGPHSVCHFVCCAEFWFRHHILTGTYQHLSILIAVATMRVWEELRVMVVQLWRQFWTWKLSGRDMRRHLVATFFFVGQWVEMLILRQDYRCCRQSTVDRVGVGKWGKRNKYTWSMRILPTTSNPEVNPKCYGFRKNLNKHKNKIFTNNVDVNLFWCCWHTISGQWHPLMRKRLLLRYHSCLLVRLLCRLHWGWRFNLKLC